MISDREFVQLNSVDYESLDIADVMTKSYDEFSSEFCLASSLSVEDQILTTLLLKQDPDAFIFVLDTGRLHQETYDVMQQTMAKYNFKYQVFTPDSVALAEMVRDYGPNLFYESVENRKLCCGIRKMEPLKRALSGKRAWITGLRKEQSVTRSDLSVLEWDSGFEMVKLNPLLHWSTQQVWDYVAEHDIPVNDLHKKGFPSIGCEPCTREVKKGDDFRSGRWWWENPENRECGLHVKKDKGDT